LTFQARNVVEIISFCSFESVSGNLMSNLTTISPRLLGCLGKGNPSPVSRFSVVGLITSFNCNLRTRFCSSVGTVIVVPHNAYE